MTKLKFTLPADVKTWRRPIMAFEVHVRDKNYVVQANYIETKDYLKFFIQTKDEKDASLVACFKEWDFFLPAEEVVNGS